MAKASASRRRASQSSAASDGIVKPAVAVGQKRQTKVGGNGSTKSLERPFRPIIGARAADEVIDQLAFAIRSGVYPPGHRLPSLPELAETMKVSRPTVGEALKQLSEVGVLQVRRGATGGITVVSNNVPARALRRAQRLRPGTLREILEARRPVEIEIARLAAVRGTEEDFEALQNANDQLTASLKKKVEWGFANSAFHYALGRAARSDTLAYFQHIVIQEIADRLDSWSDRYSDPQRTIRDHEETLKALRTRDPDIAAEAMDDHLKELEEVAEWFDDPKQRSRKTRKTRRRTSRR